MKTIKEITGAKGWLSCDDCSTVQNIEHLFYEGPSEEHSIGRKLCESCISKVETQTGETQ